MSGEFDRVTVLEEMNGPKSPLLVGAGGVFIDLSLGREFSQVLSRSRLSISRGRLMIGRSRLMIGRSRLISFNTSLVVHLLLWFYASSPKSSPSHCLAA